MIFAISLFPKRSGEAFFPNGWWVDGKGAWTEREGDDLKKTGPHKSWWNGEAWYREEVCPPHSPPWVGIRYTGEKGQFV